MNRRDQLIYDLCITRKLVNEKSMNNSTEITSKDIDQTLYGYNKEQLETMLKAEKQNLVAGRKRFFN